MFVGIEPSRSRRLATFIFAFCFVPPLLAACSSSSSKSDAGASNILIQDKNNYQVTKSSLAIPHVQTPPGADLSISWTTLSTDLLCHAVTPATDINKVYFLEMVGLTETEIQDELGANTLDPSNVDRIGAYTVDSTNPSTSVHLSDFSGISPASDYIESSDKIYMLLFAHGTTVGAGNRSLLFLDPTEGSTNNSVTAPEGCPSIGSPILTFEADITNPTPVSVPISDPSVVVDWSNMTKDGFGNAVVFKTIDSLLLGHYDMTLAELQTRLRDMESIATSIYKITIPKGSGAKSAELSTALEETSNEKFPGFTTDGVWALALECSVCPVPAPVVVAILNPS